MKGRKTIWKIKWPLDGVGEDQSWVGKVTLLSKVGDMG